MEQINVEFGDEVKKALFGVVKDLLQMDTFKVRIEPGSRKDEKETSKLFLKVAPSDEYRRKQFHVRKCFLREIYIYEKILPYFREFQEDRDILVNEDGFHEYCLCYKSIDAEPIECLFLQDLSKLSFSMVDKREVTVEHILLVMNLLGKFHAVSYAIKDQQPDQFSEIVNKLQEHIYRHGYSSDLTEAYNAAAMNVINSITDDQDVHLLEAVLRLYERDQYDIMVECVDGNAAEPHAVIVHGDMWSNNTMFQFNDANIPTKACLIDWQIARYASPVLDVLYYIFLSTTKELRGRNYNMYLKTYYESLSSHLRRLGSDPDEVFPFSALQEQLQKFGKYALIQASFLLPVLMAEVDIDVENNNSSPDLSDIFKTRLRDIASDVYRLGYI
ncbi:uncharacterized protein LOC129571502 isoform X2 [Sitodiplosis mosellana]|uniref:uncharacterized protein LOC129571502 isoform X2 n=1 Tax=Sitodiplosis mosellana TaxID=263140 RepID=UPI0024447473|nr:uncharacterized protein LOC129571502 isoform X2 [Sitodiplosis mosellana]